jgi:hypothetical protein
MLILTSDDVIVWVDEGSTTSDEEISRFATAVLLLMRWACLFTCLYYRFGSEATLF